MQATSKAVERIAVYATIFSISTANAPTVISITQALSRDTVRGFWNATGARFWTIWILPQGFERGLLRS
jgi:hypothetical protein